MNSSQAKTISAIRTASRELVRELGFLNQTLAGTEMSASTVHAIIEIGLASGITAKTLGQILLLEKSTISRLVKSLVKNGLVLETPADFDGRMKFLNLSVAGQSAMESIVEFAENQVASAIAPLNEENCDKILEGLEIYAAALGKASSSVLMKDEVVVHEGYTPGLIGKVAAMHALYYSKHSGFGADFEALVAGGLAEFIPRLGSPKNAIWYATKRGTIVGSLTIDGEDLDDNIAHLRWFIVDDGLRGAGLGRRFMQAVVDYCDEQKFDEIHLWTFQGLDAARKLYEVFDFALVDEQSGSQWGKEVIEQKFVRRFP
ncbi:MAG: helix-turn-helix domain-containing GNAT family N-acetyltransferase [Rhizobiaceae bacterium]